MKCVAVSPEPIWRSVSNSRTVSKTRSLLTSLRVESQNLLNGSLPDDDVVDHDKTDTVKSWLPSPSTTDVFSPINVTGDEDLRYRLPTSYIECKDIFSNELPAAPSEISEFHLTVRTKEWRVREKRAPPRPQSTIKQAALSTTWEILSRQIYVIRKSNGPHYSQVLLVPKPDETFCMCVDNRALNDGTQVGLYPTQLKCCVG